MKASMAGAAAAASANRRRGLRVTSRSMSKARTQVPRPVAVDLRKSFGGGNMPSGQPAQGGSEDDGEAPDRPKEELHPEDLKDAVSILHTTKEHFREAETNQPSRLVKDLFLEPSQADHEDLHKMDAADPNSADFLGACGHVGHHRAVVVCQDLRDHFWFRTSIIGFIILAGVLVGVQTYPLPNPDLSAALVGLDQFVLAVFTAEIAIKVFAEGRYPWKFFYDRWNVFDFIVVLIGYLPFDTNGVTALRSARLIRVLKLVRALPKLRVLVLGLLSSLTSISYIALLLLLLFYLYAVLGVSVFGGNDPVHFGTLHIALISLFRAATLEDWSDLMYINFYGCANYGYEDFVTQCVDNDPQPAISAIYFVSFIVLSSMLVLNTFVSVITSSMAEARAALEDEQEATMGKEDIADDDEYLEAKLNDLTEVMGLIADEVEAFAVLEKQRKANAVAEMLSADMSDSEEEGEEGGASPAPWSAPKVVGGGGGSPQKGTGVQDSKGGVVPAGRGESKQGGGRVEEGSAGPLLDDTSGRPRTHSDVPTEPMP